MHLRDSAAGFTLVEALVATVLVCTAVAGVAQLGVVAVAQSAAVQRDAVALWLAQSKIEALRSRPWSFDSAGARLSDSALILSSPDALAVDTVGFVEYLDRFGEPVMATAATFHRRWAIGLVEPSDPDTLRFQACVLTRESSLRGTRPVVCVSTVRTRRLP
jgi:type II secretory pathway pseudopilin PulG